MFIAVVGTHRLLALLAIGLLLLVCILLLCWRLEALLPCCTFTRYTCFCSCCCCCCR